MSVDIEPLELSFRRPFTVEVSQILTLKNPGSTPLAFKVKTTAPKQYCVRPNAGRIEPGQSFDVTVLLQAMKAEPAPDAKCRDKFLVQCAPITSDKEFASIATVLDGVDKAQLQERKIRVNWLPAEGENASAAAVPVGLMTPSKPNATNGATDTPDASRTFSSPSAGSAPPPYSDDKDAAGEKSALAAGASIVSRTAAAASSAAQTTFEEVKAKLAKAEADLANLKDSGLRQRQIKGDPSSEKQSSTGQVTQAVKHSGEGVSVQVVAILCLLSFLLAYFFF